MGKQDRCVRLRLLFEHRRVLTKPQRLEGLDRCWFLLRSDLSTVSDLECDITRAFQLQSTCPNGLVLSMDGFVLPPFESTDLFRDRDLIRVRKNKGAIQLCEDDVQIENGDGTLEKQEQPQLTCSPIVAIEQFEKESGGYLTDEEDGFVEKLEEPNALCNSYVKKAPKKKKRKRKDSSPSSSKRRKHHVSENLTSLCESRLAVTVENDCCCFSEDNTGNIQDDGKSYNGCAIAEAAKNLECNGIKEDEHISSKKRRKKSRQTNDPTAVSKDAEMIIQTEASQHNVVDLRRKPNGLHKSPDGMNLEGDGNVIPTGIVESLSTMQRQEHLQEKSTESEPEANGEVKKVPSRSARRKKAKRRLLREAKLSTSKLEESQLNSYKSSARCSNDLDIKVPSAGNTEDTVIPIVVRPGHIRFEHSDEDIAEENQGLHANDTFHSKSTGAIEWNGPLDKKKGQKWGRMRASSTWNNEKIPQDEQSRGNSERESVISQPEDYEKLCPITGSPKVGDVLAYRLVELSSTWCPEVSSFRVGRVASFDPVTTQYTLVTVPGYEIPLSKAAESSEMQPEPSLYNDDGSLEIEFTSLVDVRLLEGAKSGVASTSSCRKESVQDGSNLVNTTGEGIILNSGEAPPEKKEAYGCTILEEIEHVIAKKKAELQQQNGYNKQEENDPPAKRSWSYRALRGSALGPTISLLRANNAL